ncbi:MAG TPA: DUF5009 domain-containing protein [Ignavibacteriaceae bacterium]|nr:DUF5009 domain-containing protein [Ignavibacteriaceae bacterium]
MSVEKSDRLLSLDVFRGITIMGMILVNNPGSWSAIYPALGHAKWHGVTPTDLIFPFFLFIVGVAITLSLTKRKERGDNVNKIILQVVKRSAIIFLLGLLLSSFPYFVIGEDGVHWYNFMKIRIPGVLQRIAVVYLFAGIIFLKTNLKTQAILAGSFLIIYAIIMQLLPVPGQGYPSLEPATNMGAWLDRTVLGGNLWSGSKVWDPEGILSTLPAISTCLSGILLGHWLRTKIEPSVKIVWMFVIANALLIIGMIWDMWFPINKGIWTSSYVCYTSGMALHFFAMCYWLIDVKGYRGWWTKPFIIYGMNAIAVFWLSGALARVMAMPFFTNADGTKTNMKAVLYNNFFVPFFSPINASLAWAIVYVLFWLFIMWIFYKKQIFIKV